MTGITSSAAAALGLAGSSVMQAFIAGQRKVSIQFTSVLLTIDREPKDIGPSWFDDLPALEDGSPCLNALAKYPALGTASGMADIHETVARASASWGARTVASYCRGSTVILVPEGAFIARMAREACGSEFDQVCS